MTLTNNVQQHQALNTFNIIPLHLYHVYHSFCYQPSPKQKRSYVYTHLETTLYMITKDTGCNLPNWISHVYSVNPVYPVDPVDPIDPLSESRWDQEAIGACMYM